MRSTESLLLDHRILWYSLCFLFILLTSFDSLLLELHIALFDLFIKWYFHVCKHYMYYCSTLLSLFFIYITCLGHFRLSVYTWGIFLAYIRRRLSSCLRLVYFEKRGVTGFSWYQSQVTHKWLVNS